MCLVISNYSILYILYNSALDQYTLVRSWPIPSSGILLLFEPSSSGGCGGIGGSVGSGSSGGSGGGLVMAHTNRLANC